MIDPQAKPAAYVKLLALVVVLGVISALVTFAFIALVQMGTQRLWEDAAQALGLDVRLFTILVGTTDSNAIELLLRARLGYARDLAGRRRGHLEVPEHSHQ